MANNISNEKIQQILDLYNKNILLKEIAEKLEIHYTTVSRVLNRHNLSIKKRKFNFKENIFSNIDTPEKAYWLGFIFADGSNDLKNGLRISLSIKDITHLEKFLKFLCFDKTPNIKIRKIKNKEYCSIKITSKILYNDLANNGIKHNKTKNPEYPKINPSYYIDFLRGFFDGDGCVSYQEVNNKFKNITCIFTLNKIIVPYIEPTLNDIIFPKKWVLSNHWRTDYIKCLRINGFRNCLLFLEKIYNNSEIYLERKYEKYQTIKNAYTV